MKKSLLVLVTSALLMTLFPGAAKAAPGDPTIYSIDCTTSGWNYIYLEYGVSSITMTNPNGCSGTRTLNLSNGRNATWTYSQTISGTTTSGSYDPEGANLLSGAIGSADSFTLTLTSARSNYITMSNGGRAFVVYFNKEIETVNPNPVGIGQQVTVTGSNLSTVTSLGFRDGAKSFSATTTNRTATQLTFTVPLTVVDFMSGVTSNVVPGTYRLAWLEDTNLFLTVTAAPVVVSVSAEEVARLATVAAVAKRETEKRLARDSILTKFKSSEKIGLVIFTQAEIFGITPQNIVNVQTEIAALPELSRVDITPVIKIARKYEVEGIIASDRVASIYSDTLIEIGLIPEDSKYKAALTAAIKKLPASERSSLADIAEVIGAEMAEIQARNDLLKAVLTRIAARRAA